MSIRKPNITGQNGEQYITKEPGAWSRYCDVFRLVLLPDGTRRADKIHRYNYVTSDGGKVTLTDEEIMAQGYRFLRQTKADTEWLAEMLADEESQRVKYEAKEAKYQAERAACVARNRQQAESANMRKELGG